MVWATSVLSSVSSPKAHSRSLRWKPYSMTSTRVATLAGRVAKGRGTVGSRSLARRESPCSRCPRERASAATRPSGSWDTPTTDGGSVMSWRARWKASACCQAAPATCLARAVTSHPAQRVGRRQPVGSSSPSLAVKPSSSRRATVAASSRVRVTPGPSCSSRSCDHLLVSVLRAGTLPVPPAPHLREHLAGQELQLAQGRVQGAQPDDEGPGPRFPVLPEPVHDGRRRAGPAGLEERHDLQGVAGAGGDVALQHLLAGDG